MNAAYIIQLIYSRRHTLKRCCVVFLILIAAFVLFIYLVISTVVAVIQGQSNVADTTIPDNLIFAQFERFSYKTINGTVWYEFNHPYSFPTLGRLTQGVILDASAVVGLRHIAWDIADRNHSQTDVRAFADGTIVAVKDNILYDTTRRWSFCETSASGICWYQVTEPDNVQFGCGYEVIIEHADSLRSRYCHLASTSHLEVGDSVVVGQFIGWQGGTGYATGKHLHFELIRGGQLIDPSYAFSQTSLANWGEEN